MVEIALGPLTETLVATLLSLIGVVNLIQLMTLKRVSEYELLRSVDIKTRDIFDRHERGIYYYIAILGTAILSPITFALLFVDIYQSLSELDSGPYILAMVGIYWILMILWFLAQYVWTTKKTGLSLFFAILSILTAISVLLLNIITLDEKKWESYLPIALVVTSFFAIFASNTSNTYRNEQMGSHSVTHRDLSFD